MGKTTILNCIYCVLSGNIENLNSIIFDEIIVTLNDNNKLSLKHIDLSAYIEEYVYDGSYKRRRINIEHIFPSNTTVSN